MGRVAVLVGGLLLVLLLAPLDAQMQDGPATGGEDNGLDDAEQGRSRSQQEDASALFSKPFPGEPAIISPAQPQRRLSIGITVRFSTESAFVAGSLQTPLHLYDALTYGNRHDVTLLNVATGRKEDVPDDWALGNERVIDLQDLLARASQQTVPAFDIVIEVARISPSQLVQLQAQGIRVASYRPGDDYQESAETMIYNRTRSSLLYTTSGYDALLVTQNTRRSAAFLQLALNSTAHEVPLVWSPRFYKFVARSLATRKFYQPTDTKRLATMEPNLHLTKNVILPMVIMELAFRQNPELFSSAYITNTQGIGKLDAFRKFASKKMSIYKAKKMSFEARYRSVFFLSNYADVLVTHQWDNPISYLDLEALFGGYPLIHNSPLLQDCGYYYPDHDGEAGAQQLLVAMATHDFFIDNYNAKARACVERFFAFSASAAEAWDQVLLALAPQQRPYA